MQLFADFYKEITGFDPFPWQSSLADQVSQSGTWPTTIDIPTGGGKTGILLIAAWLSEQGLAPRRLAWVIDRRIVVDQVCDMAGRLLTRDWDVITLRGGVMPTKIHPARRTILATTVDQIGSRMLWQPYGQGRLSAAIHAGLVLQDCMLFLDEAHISRPFLDVVRHIGVPCVELTATPPQADAGTVFSLKSTEMGLLKKRMCSPKHIRVGEGMVKEAKNLIKSGNKTIGLICNTAKEARKIQKSLSNFKGAETILITGRQRHYERERILEEWLPVITAGRKSDPETPVFVVSTSAIEVGADLDFDAMVTECPAQDALYQRLGRCNRTGKNSSCEIVISKPTPSAKTIYGGAAENTWEWLISETPLEWTTGSLPMITEEKRTPIEGYPVLTEANRRSLLLAKLEIGPYLHGWNTSADVSIVWRDDLPKEREFWREVVELCPPATGEQVSIPLGEAVQWLDGRDFLIWTTDQEGARQRIMVGDVIVVPSSYGGMDEWGWSPDETDPVQDVAEKVERRKPIWRFPDKELTDEKASEQLGQEVRVRHALNLPYTAASVAQGWTYANESLAEHTDKVVGFLREVIDQLDEIGSVVEHALSVEEREALEKAAYWHDQGKSHPIWQTAALGHPFGSVVLGKTERLNTHLLKGFRHERESVKMAKMEGVSELVLSLVATHHGRDIPKWMDVILAQPGGFDRWAYLSSILRYADQNVDE